MNLVIDFGNTTGKAAIFKNNEIVDVLRSAKLDQIVKFSSKRNPAIGIISSTGIKVEEIQQLLPFKTIEVSHKLRFPFKISYSTPHTLGTDRLAAVTGAYKEFSGENCLIIDFGTCITYDVLYKNEYLGGAISPGLKMRFQAMNTFTSNLPLEDLSEINYLVGDNTSKSLKSGVVNGTRAEVNDMINTFCDKFGTLKVVICGGDCNFFENNIKASIFAAPELVLKGLNGILKNNA